MAKATTLNPVSFCDFCENYFATVDAYTTLHTDLTEGVCCEGCVEDIEFLDDVIMVSRKI